VLIRVNESAIAVVISNETINIAVVINVVWCILDVDVPSPWPWLQLELEGCLRFMMDSVFCVLQSVRFELGDD